jgi:D-alanine-D-alanine ligase
MDKVFANTIFDQKNIPRTPWRSVDNMSWRQDVSHTLNEADKGLAYPLFVKPACGGSSLGITKVMSREALPQALELAFSHDRKAIIEQGVRGRELEIAVLGGYGDPLLSPVGEIIPDREFYDYDSKYEAQSTSQLIIPAKIDGETHNTIRNLAVRAWRALDCYGMARIDFFLTDDGQVLLNEINTIPGFVSISMYPRLLRAAGYRDEEPLQELVRLAIEREQRME